jgi:probable HAF family extracellular repeat protein
MEGPEPSRDVSSWKLANHQAEIKIEIYKAEYMKRRTVMPEQLINRPPKLILFRSDLPTKAKLQASLANSSAVNSGERHDRHMDKIPGFYKQRRILSRILLAIGLACQFLVPSAKAQRGYTITDLGTLGGNVSFAFGINNRGQVVGNSDTASLDISHAFLYSDGQMRDLGTLGGANSYALAINVRGQVVGGSDTAGGGGHAFVYSDGQMRDIGGGTFSGAAGINIVGQLVGTSGKNAFPGHAFIYTDGQMLDIGTLGGNVSYATGINVFGQVVGWSYTTGNVTSHAFIYSNGHMRPAVGGNRWDQELTVAEMKRCHWSTRRWSVR